MTREELETLWAATQVLEREGVAADTEAAELAAITIEAITAEIDDMNVGDTY